VLTTAPRAGLIELIKTGEDGIHERS